MTGVMVKTNRLQESATPNSTKATYMKISFQRKQSIVEMKVEEKKEEKKKALIIEETAEEGSVCLSFIPDIRGSTDGYRTNQI